MDMDMGMGMGMATGMVVVPKNPLKRDQVQVHGVLGRVPTPTQVLQTCTVKRVMRFTL